MPELPEVETVRQGLLQGMLNKTFEDVLVRREGLRYPFPEDLATLAGTTVTNIRRHAKYLLVDLDEDGRVGKGGVVRGERWMGGPATHRRVFCLDLFGMLNCFSECLDLV